MKKALLLVFLFLGVTTTALIGYGSGAPQARTGSPGDGASCASSSCHSGTPVNAVGLITTDIPSTGYKPDSTYTITATISHPTRNEFGFQIAAQKPNGTNYGTLVVTNSVQTKLVGSSNYITHKSAGQAGSGNAKTWTFNWVAPLAGSGDITFYGAFNSSNNNNNASGDLITLSNTLVMEDSTNLDVIAQSNDASCWNNCDGQVTLVISGGTLPYSVTWNGGTPSSITVFPGLCEGSYTYSVQDANLLMVNGTISISAPPQTPLDITVLDNDTIFCIGDTVFLEATAGFTEYEWTDASNTQNIWTQQEGLWFVQAMDGNGCTSYSDTIELTEAGLPPVPTITQNFNLLTVDPNAVAYQWFINGLPITNGTNKNLFITANGTYTVAIYTDQGCSSTSLPYVVTDASITEETFAKITAFPNPAEGQWNFSHPLSEGTEILVHDINGRLIWENIVSSQMNSVRIPPHLNAGTYIMTLNFEGMQSRIKTMIK